ncbi:MAG: hypothetical protein A3H27_06595 [Acidobacteria bacterium RIFCSPLOWO2_02_FULL_59_13]|nr:MAG: hypothetical protein A3H27_06595 [Acidobacteria bacterium RIFCSPLOWO2_02_FULL_59_13]
MNPNGTVRNLRPFSPGQSGNPGGKPVAARNKLQGEFLRALADDFERYGIYAIARARRMDPLGYVKVCASLMPKEFELTRSLNEFTDEQLDAAIITIRAILAVESDGSNGANAIELQPSKNLPARQDDVRRR